VKEGEVGVALESSFGTRLHGTFFLGHMLHAKLTRIFWLEAPGVRARGLKEFNNQIYKILPTARVFLALPPLLFSAIPF
jgi:hypothetical protein